MKDLADAFEEDAKAKQEAEQALAIATRKLSIAAAEHDQSKTQRREQESADEAAILKDANRQVLFVHLRCNVMTDAAIAS